MGSLVLSRAMRPAAALVAGPSAASSLTQRRFASHHHHEEPSNDVYPEEGFNSALWKYGAGFVVATGLWYRYAPKQSPDVLLTQWLAAGATPAERWLEIIVNNTALIQEEADRTKILNTAAPPAIIRFKNPASLYHVSHQKGPVAPDVDMTGVRIKTDKDMW